MQPIYKIMGQRGRTTVPLSIRNDIGLTAGDLVSVTRDGDTVMLTRERRCDKCESFTGYDGINEMLELSETLNSTELITAIIKLLLKWAGNKNGDNPTVG